MNEREIEQTVSIFIKSYAGDAIKDMAAVKKATLELIKANPELANSILGIQKAARQASDEYLNGMNRMSQATQKTQEVLGKLHSTVNSLVAPVQKLAGLVGEGLGLKNSYDVATRYNNALSGLSISFTKYGTNVTQVEKALHNLSQTTGLTRQTTGEFMKMYERGFNFTSLQNAENLLKNIQKVVGSDVEAIKHMAGELSSFTKQFPDLEKALTNLEGSDKRRLDSQTRLLYMSGRISQDQFKSAQDYLKGSSQQTAADQKKLKDLQAQEAAIQEMKKAFEGVALSIGTQLLPYFQQISNFAKESPAIFKALAIGAAVAPAAAQLIHGHLMVGSKIVGSAGAAAKAAGGWLPKTGKLGMIGSALSLGGGAAEKGSMIVRKASAQDVFVVGGKLDSFGGKTGEIVGKAGDKGLDALRKKFLQETESGLSGLGAGAAGASAAGAGAAGVGTAGTAGAAASGGMLGVGAAGVAGLSVLAATAGAIVGGIVNKIRGISFGDQAHSAKDVFMHPIDSVSAAMEYGLTEKSQQKALKKSNEFQPAMVRNRELKNQTQQDNSYDEASYAISSGQEGAKKVLANKRIAQRNLEQIDKTSGYEKKRARFDSLTDKINKGKNSIGEDLSYKEKKELEKTQERLGKELASIEQARLPIQNKIIGYEKAQNEQVAIFKAQVEAANDLLQQQTVKAQSIITLMGALGPASAKGMAEFDKQSQGAFETMQKVAGLQSQQLDSIIEEQSALKQSNAIRRQEIISKPIDRNDKAAVAKRNADLAKLKTSDTSADMLVESSKQKMEASLNQIPQEYAKLIASKADVNRPEIARREKEAGTVKAQTEMSQSAGNFGEATRGQQYLAGIARTQQGNVKTSIAGVQQSLANEQIALRTAKTEQERQSHKAAIVELENQENSLQAELVKYQKEEIDYAIALGRVNEKAIEQQKSITALRQAQAEQASAGGSTKQADAYGEQATKSIVREKALTSQERQNLEGQKSQAISQQSKAALKLQLAPPNSQAADAAYGEYEAAAAKVREIEKDLSAKKAVEIQQNKQLLETEMARTRANQGVLEFESAKLGKMETELELMNNLGAGLSASVDQRMRVLDQVKKTEALEQEQLTSIKERLATEEQRANIAAQNKDKGEEEQAQANILKLQTEREKKENSILNIQMKQAQMTKTLRDGYLSAITAMTAGSGLITKIVVDQNKNMGIGIEKLGMLQNRTLGGIGSAQGGSGVRSSSKMGVGGFSGPSQDVVDRQSPNYYNGRAGANAGTNRQRLLDNINRNKSMASQAAGTPGSGAIGEAVNTGKIPPGFNGRPIDPQYAPTDPRAQQKKSVAAPRIADAGGQIMGKEDSSPEVKVLKEQSAVQAEMLDALKSMVNILARPQDQVGTYGKPNMPSTNVNPFRGKVDDSISGRTGSSGAKVQPIINVNVQLTTDDTKNWSAKINEALKQALNGTGLLTGSSFRT
jgi:hypothetical protein